MLALVPITVERRHRLGSFAGRDEPGYHPHRLQIHRAHRKFPLPVNTLVAGNLWQIEAGTHRSKTETAGGFARQRQTALRQQRGINLKLIPGLPLKLAPNRQPAPPLVKVQALDLRADPEKLSSSLLADVRCEVVGKFERQLAATVEVAGGGEWRESERQDAADFDGILGGDVVATRE